MPRTVTATQPEPADTMKFFFRYVFKTIRIVLGPFLLAWERLTTPAGIVRSPAAQARVDALARDLTLFQFKTCPFCMKVRRELARHSLKIDMRDAQYDLANRRELAQQGGQIKVPCLRITAPNGRQTWLYESDAIIRYLQEFVGSAA